MTGALRTNTTLIGDCRTILPTLEAGTFACCVTSPPYWGLRDYGHADQIGLESTPAEYVEKLVGVFREVRRVLRDDGTLWLNLGDSYSGGGGYAPDAPSNRSGSRQTTQGSRLYKSRHPAHGLKPKDLVGIPWLVAFALRADGWHLRSDIIWAKRNPMPESVTDRPTKAHEYVFLLSKSERYFYDAAAIAEPAVAGNHWCSDQGPCLSNVPGNRPHVAKGKESLPGAPRNARTVWSIASEPYTGAHFATMPTALVTRCILAGSPLGGAVLDPFMGSGTVGQVAESLGRTWLGCELSADYGKLAEERTAQSGLAFGKTAT